jgi:hypothetical protein
VEDLSNRVRTSETRLNSHQQWFTFLLNKSGRDINSNTQQSVVRTEASSSALVREADRSTPGKARETPGLDTREEEEEQIEGTTYTGDAVDMDRADGDESPTRDERIAILKRKGKAREKQNLALREREVVGGHANRRQTSDGVVPQGNPDFQTTTAVQRSSTSSALMTIAKRGSRGRKKAAREEEDAEDAGGGDPDGNIGPQDDPDREDSVPARFTWRQKGKAREQNSSPADEADGALVDGGSGESRRDQDDDSERASQKETSDEDPETITRLLPRSMYE